MAAVKRTPRNTQDVDPFNVDLSDIPQTPVITSLHDLAKLRHQIEQIHELLDAIVLDATELALAEGQTQTSILLAKGKPFTWRSQLNKILRRDRDIDAAAQEWRERARDIKPQRTPSYLRPETIDTIRRKIALLHKAVSKIEEARDLEYPEVHARAKAAIEGVPAKAS